MTNVLLVGLGNPGKKYETTRHNVGVVAVRAWVASMSPSAVWRSLPQVAAESVVVNIGDMVHVTCLFPLTFMNTSGEAVAEYCRLHSVSPERIILVHDELEIPFSEMQWRERGSAAGHNGVKSIQAALATQDIRRLRIGIGRPTAGEPVDAYVLSPFTNDEAAVLQEKIVPAAVQQISDYVRSL